MTSDPDADEPPTSGPASGVGGDHRRKGALIFLGLVAAVAVAFVLGRGDGRPENAGAQLASLTARVQDPGTREWVMLTPTDRSFREGFPVPMIARDDQVCLGFGRTDFDPPLPSLARCVEAADIPEIPAEGLISLVVVRAGADTWHLLATAGENTAVQLTAEDGSVVDPGRIHLDDEFVALRLDAATELAGMNWIIGRTRFVCLPPPDAARTGLFCPDITTG